MKKKLIFILFLFLFISLINGAFTSFDFEETWLTASFDYDCVNVSKPNPTPDELSATINREFQNTWYCGFDGIKSSTVTSFVNDSRSNTVNTVQGMSGVTTGNNEVSNLMTIFSDTVFISNDADFSFYCDNLKQDNGHMWLVFGKDNQSYYGLALDDFNVGGDSTCRADFNWTVGGNDCCDLNDEPYFNDLCLNSNATKINFTGQNISDSCSSWDNYNDGTITMMGFRFSGGTPLRVGTIDDLVFNNILLGTNDLPSFNLSTNDTIKCIQSNNASSVANFDLNISVFDPEEDTIFYTSGISSINYSDFRDFNKFVCLPFQVFCSNLPDFDLIESNFIIPDGTCNINTVPNSAPNIDEHNIVLDFDAVGDESQNLQLNGNCNESDKAVYYDYKKIFLSGFIELEFLDFQASDRVNVSLLPSDFIGEYLHLGIIRFGNLYLVFSVIDNNITTLFNFTSPADFFRLSFTNTQNISNYIIEATYSSDGLSLDSTKSNISNLDSGENNFRYLRTSINENNTVFLNSITSVLNQYEFDWQPTFDTTLELNRIGMHNYFSYVTDEPHQNESFSQQNIWFTVVECEGSYDFELDNPTYQGFLTSGNTVYFKICDSSNNVLQLLFGSINLNINLCTAFYYIYLIFCLLVSLAVATAVFHSLFSPYLAYGIASMVFSLSQILLYRIFMFSTNVQIALAVIFATGMVSLFVGLFGAKTGA